MQLGQRNPFNLQNTSSKTTGDHIYNSEPTQIRPNPQVSYLWNIPLKVIYFILLVLSILLMCSSVFTPSHLTSTAALIYRLRCADLIKSIAVIC